MGAVPKENDVAGAITARSHRVAFQYDRAFEDQDGFVEIVVPVEFACAALTQHQGGGKAIGALRQRAVALLVRITPAGAGSAGSAA
jgi:hypothetical protein